MWVPENPIDYNSTVIQVMVWCPQATNHYLSQCWSRSFSPNGITRTQGVNQYCKMTSSQCRFILCYKNKKQKYQLADLPFLTWYLNIESNMSVTIRSHIFLSVKNSMFILDIFKSIAMKYTKYHSFIKPQAFEHCTMPLLIYQSIHCMMWCRIQNDAVQLCNLVLMACTEACICFNP